MKCKEVWIQLFTIFPKQNETKYVRQGNMELKKTRQQLWAKMSHNLSSLKEIGLSNGVYEKGVV